MDEQDEALLARAQARVGTTLRGKYRLDRVLGIGGMATVFAATHRNQAELAVKVLHPELSIRDDLKKRFLREGYVGNSVKHPGAVLVVDDDIAEDGSAFLVMELLRGCTLEDLWERHERHLSTRVVTALALQLLEVLVAAHEKAIVHRDLKPANLFLSADGSLKVLDFGIARLRDALGGNEHATRTGTLMGTPAFMAPEQAQAIATEIDGQTDLWAVGATMFTLLSGQLVHDGDNSSQLLIKAGTARARPVLTVAPDTDPAIAAVVDRALTFEKAGRWPTAELMHDALVSASAATYGAPPGRDILSSLIEPDARRADSVHSKRPYASAPGGVPSPRLIVNDGSDIRGNDPTFAPPTGGLTPPGRGSEPRFAVPGYPGIASPGHSTGNPVSAQSVAPRAPGGLSGSRVVAAIAVIIAGGAIAFAFSSRSVQPSVGLVVNGQPRTPAQVASAFQAALSPEAVPVPPPLAASTTAPAATVSASPLPPPPPPPATVATPPVPPTSTPHSTRAAPKVDCTVPFTLDSNGDKKWTEGCQQ